MDDELLDQENEAEKLNEETPHEGDTPFDNPEHIIDNKGGEVRRSSSNPDEDEASTQFRVDYGEEIGFGDIDADDEVDFEVDDEALDEE
jgi:hypothetical protein